MDYENESSSDEEFFECRETQDDSPKTHAADGTRADADTPTTTPTTATNHEDAEVKEDDFSEIPMKDARESTRADTDTPIATPSTAINPEDAGVITDDFCDISMKDAESSLPNVSTIRLNESNEKPKRKKNSEETIDTDAIIADVLAEAEKTSDDDSSSVPNPDTSGQEATAEAGYDPKAPPEFRRAKEGARKGSSSDGSGEEELTEEELEERTQRTKEIKERGNERFKNGDYEKAKELYTEGLQICPKSLKKDRSVLFSNRSACLMKLEKNEEAVKDCSKAIRLHPTYLKAILRRAELHDRLEKYEDAQKDYETVLKMDPSIHAARVALLQLPAKIERRNEKLKEQMMTGLKDLGNIILQPFGLTTDHFRMQQDPNTGSYNIQFNNNQGNGPNRQGS